MTTQEFSECCFLPVFKSGDNKYQRQSRCSGCGCVCNVIAMKDTTGCDELHLTVIPVHYNYSAVAEPLRVDFTREKDFYLEDIKMVDSIGNDV